MTARGLSGAAAALRLPAVAGAFYPGEPGRLRALVTRQLTEAKRGRRTSADPGLPIGILVPHAGLEYSGVVAAAAWRLLAAGAASPSPPTVVLLGTNHRAAWLDGIGAWDHGAWSTPLGEVTVDEGLAAAVVGLGPPFIVDLEAHRDEHSLEVQLPFLREVAPGARILPLAVSTGVGRDALEAGWRLGALIDVRRQAGARIVLAISSDMAHYPSGSDAERVTAELLPAILQLDGAELAAREGAIRAGSLAERTMRGLVCGMCGIEPTVVGLEALRAAGATRGTVVAEATSADAGGPADQAVGYLAVAFD